jgi:hypothetical protein
VDRPVPVSVRGDLGPLVGIHAEIEDQRKPPEGERLSPNVQCAGRLLLGEHDLPVAVPQRDDLAVIVEIDKALAVRIFLLAGQMR